LFTIQREKNRVQLEREIRTETYQTLLQHLQTNTPSFHRYQSWLDVAIHFQEFDFDDPGSDPLLKPVLEAHQRDGDAKWRKILLVMFWHLLIRLHRSHSRWLPDDEARWSELYWHFDRAVCRIDPERRPERLAQKLFNDTKHGLYETCIKERGWTNNNRSLTCRSDNDEDSNEVEIACTDPSYREVEERLDLQVDIALLRSYRDRGLINETEFHLIIGSRIYGRPLRELAHEVGLGYEAARKCCQRANARIPDRPKIIPKS